MSRWLPVLAAGLLWTVPVQANGQIFRLGDVATVKRGYEDPPSFIVREDGKPALGLGVSMQDGANIITLGKNLKGAMKAVISSRCSGLSIPDILLPKRCLRNSTAPGRAR